jgi:hypothetical protein
MLILFIKHKKHEQKINPMNFGLQKSEVRIIVSTQLSESITRETWKSDKGTS